MSSELRRGTLRVASNYLRLFATLAIGLVMVWVILDPEALGEDGTGVLGFLGSSFGLAAMVLEISRESMIRELGAAHHDPTPGVFTEIYNSSIFVALASGLLSLALFAVFIACLPWIMVNESQPMRDAAFWFLIIKSVQTLFEVVLSPQFNMMIVTERMVAFNFYTTIHRSMLLVAAFVVAYGPGIETHAQGVIVFGAVSASLQLLVLFAGVAWVVMGDRRLIPRPGAASWNGTKQVVAVGGWNVAIGTAMRLHERIASIIMMRTFGTWGALVFDQIAFRLTSYVRLLTSGMTTGSEAVTTRLASQSGDSGVRRFLKDSTRLHAWVAFPAAFMLFVLAEPLVTVWIGARISDVTVIPSAVFLIRIMVIGIAARSIADGWIRILYGAGHIARYAPLIFLGGITNPVTAIILLYILPDPLRYTAVAWAFSGAFILFHIILLPMASARLIGATSMEMLTPTIRPLVIALACSPILVVGLWGTGGGMTELWLALGVGGYGLLYLVLSIYLVFPKDMRDRVLNAARRKLGRSRNDNNQ